MTNKRSAQSQAVALAKSRHFATLDRAYAVMHGMDVGSPLVSLASTASYHDCHAAVFASYPGRQTDKNMVAAMDAAIKAVAKSIRKRKVV